MKSTVIEGKSEKEIVYPCLMRSPNTVAVFLITGRNVSDEWYGCYIGTCVNRGMGCDSFGCYRDTWSDELKPFHGKVTLEN